MKKTLALLVASTALSTAVCLPAWSAMRVSLEDSACPPSGAALLDDRQEALPLVFVSDDDDHDDDDDDHDDDDHDDDDDCDDDDCRGSGSNPAPTGAIAPPQNGLFGSGAPPQVLSN